MIGVFGILITFGMVFGGYLAAGGKLSIIIGSLPYELMIIGGAAAGAFVVGNDLENVKRTLADIKKVFTGPKWKTRDFNDLFCLLFEIIRTARRDPLELERHIEATENSSIFAKYPKISADPEAIDLICDTMRSAAMSYDDPHQVEDAMEKRIETNHEQAMQSVHALQTAADGLPALGIVAAVLGVIKTMGSIDEPPEILGKLIAGALVGTFLGVFLAYGFVGPFSSRLKAIKEEDNYFYRLIGEVLVANLHQHPPNMCIEIARQNTPRRVRPSFSDLEKALKERRSEPA